MATVFDILHGVGQRLPGAWYTGVADSGSTTTIQDADIGGKDDAPNRGTALVYLTTDGAAPQGESRIISDYDAKGNVAGNGLVTVETAFTAAVGAGDRFGIIRPRYRRELILEKINDALLDLPYAAYDTSITISSGVKRYALPSGVHPNSLLQVHTGLNTTDPYDWVPLYNWHPEGRVTASDPTSWYIVFSHSIPGGNIIRLTYRTTHAAVYADSDVIQPVIDQDLLTWASLVRVLQWRYGKFPTAPSRETDALNTALRYEDDLQGKAPILPQAFPRLPDTPFAPISTSDEVPYPVN